MASAAEAATAARPSAQYDLLPKIAPFLDPHMVFPFLTFLNGTDMYDPTDVKKAMFEAARKTGMAEFAIDCYKAIHGEAAEAPADLTARIAELDAETVRLSEAAAPLKAVVDDAEVMDTLIKTSSFTPQHLAEAHGISAEHIEALKAWAKHQHEMGVYEDCAYLKFYRELQPVNSGEGLRAQWGKLAGSILGLDWDTAAEDRERLDRMIAEMAKSGALSDAAALQQRSWLLHWSLFVFSFRVDERAGLEPGREALLSAFLQDEANLAAIQLNAPWLLRYAAAALLGTKSKRRYPLIKQLLRVVTGVGSPLPYGSDPLVDFLVALLHKFDFEAAQAALAAVPSVIVSDFFLRNSTPAAELLEAARRLLFETYCRIHQKISLESLASKLHMSEGEAERWLIDLIQAAELDAKIDSTERQVVMAAAKPSVYQQVVDKTRDLTLRTRTLADNVEEALGESAGAGGAAAGAGGAGGRYKSGY